MRRLITILAVFSLACLGAGVASAESDPPAGYDIIDFVNIGDPDSEVTLGVTPVDHNLIEWGPSFDADAACGFTGNSDYYRQVWGWDTGTATFKYLLAQTLITNVEAAALRVGINSNL